MNIDDVVLNFNPSTLQVNGVIASDHNMVRATLDGLKNSTTASEVAAKRGLTVEELFA